MNSSDRIAIHEAGHALASELLGVRVEGMQMLDSGVVQLRPCRLHPKTAMVLTIAGCVASQIFSRSDEELAADREGCIFAAVTELVTRSDTAQDYEDFVLAYCQATGARAFCGPTLIRYALHVGNLAAEMLIEHWPALIALAKEIGHYRPVSGDEVRTTMLQNGAQPRPRQRWCGN